MPHPPTTPFWKSAGARASDPLYVVFTSGSTGTPKGVAVSHRNVISFIEEFVPVVGLGADDVLGGQAPFDFDISVKDLYSTIKCGATLCVIPRSYFSVPVRLLAFLSEQRVTTLIWAVSAMSILATLKALDGRSLPDLRRVLFSGEVMPIKHLAYWREHVPQACYTNLYGPTEITCNCLYYHVPEDALPETLPLGVPFANARVLVLDEADQACAAGEIGELCVAGEGVALGYYDNPAATERAFVQNPLNHTLPERIYRSGDLASRGQDGLYYFHGRRDSQVKHMGHRIELGEIEAAAESLEAVEASCCVYRADESRIVLVYAAAEPQDEAIYGAIRARLPGFMRPHRLVWLEALPRNARGKVDRASIWQEYGHAASR
ncbi:MAG: amino acid adenylation domain-containing protein [Chloroflexi bacterium]|nr:amino acid adenylation domain-containing protein [Chloroflexota bacterium]